MIIPKTYSSSAFVASLNIDYPQMEIPVMSGLMKDEDIAGQLLSQDHFNNLGTPYPDKGESLKSWSNKLYNSAIGDT